MLSPARENSLAPVSKKELLLLRAESECVREGTGGIHFSTLWWKLWWRSDGGSESERRPEECRSDGGWGAVWMMIVGLCLPMGGGG
jgi:hypothetical protein